MPMRGSRNTSPKTHKRRKISLLVGIMCAALALLITSPGVSQAGDADPYAIEPGEAYMGVGVAQHEGGDGTFAEPDVSPLQTVEGVDVASHQGDVDWATLYGSGVQFAYAKATEGVSSENPYFAQQYNGSYDTGMIRGAYHFALPDVSSGADQANFFADNGGGWSADGVTLPGVLDIEYNPYGETCFGLSAESMVAWIADFMNTYYARTGRYAVIYTTTDWWTTCTGNYDGFGANHPLWIARYSDSPGTLPAGWATYTFWQYTSTGPTVGDHNVFNGAYDRLQALANNG
jgi:GH25 family lysozyme M1 (1,4-beta-N-acetylmuramidase)